MTMHEVAAMSEESYTVDGKGVVHSIPRFIPLQTSIRLIIHIVKRYRPNYKIDLNSVGWKNLKVAVAIRNRLVHPKNLQDLSLTDLEIRQCTSAFFWLLTMVIEVLRESNEDVKEAIKLAKYRSL